MKRHLDCESLIDWFKEIKRDLPWRRTSDPYAIWVSEVMLQQTQVSVVVPYFLRWMDRFPTVQQLAKAPLEVVIKTWEGLGYYSRARNLHEGANYLVQNTGGTIPNDETSLSKIKGLGPYTIGAILSFAFHQKIPAVDGNVMRVLARYFGLYDDIAKSSTNAMMRKLANEILPNDGHWIVNEALIELGATICQRKANCMKCPLKASCQGFLKGLTDELPVKSKAVKTTHLFRSVAVIICEEHILVKKGSKGKVMSDLYEFLYIEIPSKEACPTEFARSIKKLHNLQITLKQSLSEVKHGFTRYQAHLFPFLYSAENKQTVEGYEWVKQSELNRLAFSSGHKRILNQLNF